MTDIFNKILGVLLAFTLLAGGPLVINTMGKDLTMNRSVLNEMTNLINKVSDDARLSPIDLSDFYLGVSSYGITMDATVRRYVKTVNPDGSGGTYTSYVLTDDVSKWNEGDIIKVTVKAIDYTAAQRIQYRLLHLSPPKFDQTLAGMVRK
ncbi:hypothetical protein EHS13_29880 [Paenibacillus psychroresistens]|uniref:Uncharacterized protein n=1 Tax=Paenibacillus psychroresistens TaxID=1778678 RepID=A0A6B8RTZ8_9BACL|nr:hypothetical protein [Paenibacillus psychroresistens]QGQ98786.1 hypothetical protein EHS13_29880 [Paenibacillus psychroresistens]